MFHLLTAVSESQAFPMADRPPRRAPADARPLLVMDGASSPSHWFRPILCCGALSLALLVGAVQQAGAQAPRPFSRADKIENALSAAPAEVARSAAVKDWPAAPGAALAVLRAGSNGWVCLPDAENTPGNDPMCMDAAFYEVFESFFAGRPARITRPGYGYMLNSDAFGSNIDPMAERASPANQWHHSGPHVMIVYPDAKFLDGVPTTPTDVGPYVMFPGSPIAHVMLPVASGYLRGSHASRPK